MASLLCNEWASVGHEVHLITFDELGASSAYSIAPDIHRHYLAAPASPPGLLPFVLCNLTRVFRLRRALARVRPTVTISFLLEANVVSALASLFLPGPLIISERNHPAYHSTPWLKAALRRLTYPLADTLCVQTEEIRDWFCSKLGLRAVSVVANPAPKAPPNGSDRVSTDRRVAVCLGRLEPQKAYDHIIRAFSVIAAQVPTWDISIYGEGGERPHLQRLIDEHGLTKRIRLAGVTGDPSRVLHEADLFLHAARYEGCPNAVIEALAHGKCVIATDSPGATGELLQGGCFGILVPPENVEAYAASMLMAMTDEQLRSRLAATAPQAIQDRSASSIARRWLDHAA